MVRVVAMMVAVVLRVVETRRGSTCCLGCFLFVDMDGVNRCLLWVIVATGGRCGLFLQLERVLDAYHLVFEGLVDLDALLYLRATVDDGGVVAASDELAYT